MAVPDSEKLVHLQFRRFAGCPICNVHLQSVIRRRDEITAAGIREVVLFHSTRDELDTYVDDMPFDLVADPDRTFYRRFGVETSLRSVADPRSMAPVVKAALRSRSADRRLRLSAGLHSANGGHLGLPADILIDTDGTVVARQVRQARRRPVVGGRAPPPRQGEPLSGGTPKPLPTTERGRRARADIVSAAAVLTYQRGVRATSLDDVLAAAGCGKSQLYHYFDGKADLLGAVIDRQLEFVLAAQPALTRIDSWETLDAWLADILAIHAQPGGPFACPLGTLAVELTNDDALRARLGRGIRTVDSTSGRGLAEDAGPRPPRRHRRPGTPCGQCHRCAAGRHASRPTARRPHPDARRRRRRTGSASTMGSARRRTRHRFPPR